MPRITFLTLAVITLTFVLKGVTGMGLPTVSMGVLGAFMPAVAAASLLLISSFSSPTFGNFSPAQPQNVDHSPPPAAT